MPLDAIVLSAGRASRFGVPKFLLPAGDGHVLLTRVLEHALRTVDGRVVVVLGREARLARYALEQWAERPGNPGSRVIPILNRHYRQGQSTSLKAGIRSLGDAEGVLVFLADMPALQTQKLQQLGRAIQRRGSQTDAVVVCEQGQIRPPVFLSKTLFPQVLKLVGDQGARAILKAHLGEVLQVEWGPGPWFIDVDDWRTYRYLAQRLGWANEPFAAIPREKVVSTEIQPRLDAALASDIVPWLSPGLLLLASRGETRWLELAQTYRGVRGVILGQARTPSDRLELIRRATLAALAEDIQPGPTRHR